MLTAQNVFSRKPWQRASSTCTTQRCTCINGGVLGYAINNKQGVFTGSRNPQKILPSWLRLCNVVRPRRPRVTAMIAASAPFERRAWLKGKGARKCVWFFDMPRRLFSQDSAVWLFAKLEILNQVFLPPSCSSLLMQIRKVSRKKSKINIAAATK